MRTRLEDELAKCQREFAAGKTTISAGAGDVNKGSQREISITTRMQQIYLALYELDPDTYPIEDITPDTQTKLSFA